MAFIPVSGSVKVAVHWTLFDELLINTLWFETLGAVEWDGPNINQLCGDVWAWAEAELIPILSNDIILTLVDGVDQSQQNSFYGSYSETPVVGSVAAQSAPSGICVSVKFASDLTGRSYRGRNYVSGIPSTAIDNNQITTTFRTALTNAYSDLNTYITLDQVVHVIASRFTNNQPRTGGVTVLVQDYQIVDLNLDSQRRRLSGRGA